ncbi:MAG: protein kinase [Bacteroidetes bacterium]|jgi:serine/threonine-protein kinase|nr:protein kinase [Bacteroidota bacterium]
MEDPTVGREIDGYRITEVLGRGGMGVVYKAKEVALARHVALKRIDPAFARDKSFQRRFRSEARALARIHSPHIVQIHGLHETAIGHIIIEYVDGGTLQYMSPEQVRGYGRVARLLVNSMMENVMLQGRHQETLKCTSSG